MIENLLIQSQLSNPDNLSGFIILAASIAASIKFLLLIATAGLIIFFLYAAVTGGRESEAIIIGFTP